VLLVRYPFKNTYIGTIVSDSPLFRKYLKVQNTGIASSISRFDKIERIYAYEKNRRYGLVTTVAVSIDEALAPWRKQAIQLAVLIFVLRRYSSWRRTSCIPTYPEKHGITKR
jgi:hypothetical protein